MAGGFTAADDEGPAGCSLPCSRLRSSHTSGYGCTNLQLVPNAQKRLNTKSLQTEGFTFDVVAGAAATGGAATAACLLPAR